MRLTRTAVDLVVAVLAVVDAVAGAMRFVTLLNVAALLHSTRSRARHLVVVAGAEDANTARSFQFEFNNWLYVWS